MDFSQNSFSLLHGNEIIKIKGPLVMAAGAAPLALKLDIFKNSLYYNAGQENSPLKKKEKEKAT